MKKLLAMLLILALTAGCCFAASSAETAEENDTGPFTSGDYRYILQEDGTAKIVHYSGSAVELVIPEELDGYSVTAIGERAFGGCHTLADVTIPDCVTDLVNNPFVYCTNLLDFHVSPDHPNLAAVNGVLFRKPDKLLVAYPCGSPAESYTVPEGIREIGYEAFYNAAALTGVTIPETVTTIRDRAFAYCYNLAGITIPDSVTFVGINPFVSCNSLTAIHVSPDHPYLATINGVLFSKTDKRLIYYPGNADAKTYEIPNGIEIIGGWAFYECKNLTGITIPDSVTHIGTAAFSFSEALREIVIPDSVISLGHEVFSGCKSLTRAVLSDELSIIGNNAFYGCSALTEISIPSGLTVFGDRAFYGCSSLAGISIPENVTIIGNEVFSGCSTLTSVTLPDPVNVIGDRAFFGCCSLTDLAIPEGVAKIGLGTFDGCEKLTVTVIRDSYAAQYCKENGVQYTYPDALDWLNN